jgi:hypothetical protein
MSPDGRMHFAVNSLALAHASKLRLTTTLAQGNNFCRVMQKIFSRAAAGAIRRAAFIASLARRNTSVVHNRPRGAANNARATISRATFEQCSTHSRCEFNVRASRNRVEHLAAP